MKRRTVSAADHMRHRLVADSALPVAVAAGPNAWSITGHFALEAGKRGGRAAALLRTAGEVVRSMRGALALPPGLGKGVLRMDGDAETWWWPQLVHGTSVYGCGLAVTVRRRAVVALSARWSRTRVRSKKGDAATARALVVKHLTLDEPEARVPDIGIPRLALFDPVALRGVAGRVQSVWVFEGIGVEPAHDVVVAPDGSAILDVVAVHPAGDALTITQTPRYLLHPVHGTPRFISFPPLGLLVPEASSGDASRVALGFFKRYPGVFGTWDAGNQLLVDDVVAEPMSRGMRTVVLRQEVGPFPVWGAQLRVHLHAGLGDPVHQRVLRP